jgi:hypothetical protein
MRQKIVHRSSLWFGCVTLFGLIAATAVAQQGQGAPQKSLPPRIGQFRLNSGAEGTVDFSINNKQRTISWDLRGKNLSVTTARYDLAAPRIMLLHDYKRNIVVKGNATGGVRIEAREPDLTTVLTCDTAVYRETTGTNAPARIDVQGNVRAVVRNANFTQEDPPVLLARSGYILFPEGEDTVVHLDSPRVTGTPIEPPARSPKP